MNTWYKPPKNVLWFIILLLIISACSPVNASPINTETTAVSATTMPTEIPTWVTIPVTDSNTGKTFTVNDLRGKVVLVEGIATWCPTCWAQGNEIKALRQELNAGEDFVVISLAMDRKEDASVLNEYASIGGFDWFFVTSSIDIYRDIGNRYGATYLDPTLVPLFIIDKQGNIQNFRKGKMAAGELKSLIQPLLEAGS